MRKFVLLFLTLTAGFTGLRAQTGFLDDFTGPVSESWLASSYYSINQADGIVTMDVGKNAPDQFQDYLFSTALDITTNPVVNLRLKADQPCKVSVALVTGGNYFYKDIRLRPGDGFVDFSLDFSGDHGFVKLEKVNRVRINVAREVVNFDGTIYIDELSLGDQAVKLAGMGVIPGQLFYQGTKSHKILVEDIVNASGIEVTGANTIVQNLRVSGIYNGNAAITFDCADGQSGTEDLTVTAKALDGYENNMQTFSVTSVSNMPPAFDALEDVSTKVGTKVELPLSGIADGDATISQKLTFTVSSSDQAVIADGDIKINYKSDQPYGNISFTPAAAGEDVTITVTLDDQGSENNTFSRSFNLSAFDEFNNPPSIDPVSKLTAFNNSTLSFEIPLSGISGGEGETQDVTISVISTDQNLVADGDISLDYTTGAPTGTITFSAIDGAIGQDTFLVTLTDNGGAAGNNGNASTVLRIPVDVAPQFVTGFVSDLSTTAEWSGNSSIFTFTSIDSGGFNCLRVDANDKFLWDGININIFSTYGVELDMSENPYMSMEVYPLDDSTRHWVWFYDSDNLRNDLNNYDHGHWAKSGQWNKIFFDFSGENDWVNTSQLGGAPINPKRIRRVLMDMHNHEAVWPTPPNYNGSYLMRNIRLGDEAEKPAVQPVATIDDQMDVSLYEGAGAQQITLTGISDGNDGSLMPTLAVTSSDASFISDAAASAVQADSTATLSFTPNGAGTTLITVTVSAAGSMDKEMTFNVTALSSDSNNGSSVTIDMANRHQMIRGFGTYMNSPRFSDFYTDLMGGTAMRIGIIENQIEPVNDNDDPFTLNRAGLNYNAYNWDYFRDLKERGVKTFILTSWSPPAWMKANLDESFGTAAAPNYNTSDNKLLTTYYDEFAEYMVAAITMFKEEAGIDIYAVGIQNEPAFCEPYPSAVLDPVHFAEQIVHVAKRFEKEGIKTKFYMPEQVFPQSHYSMNEYMDAIRNNPEADKYCDIIAVHGYASDGIGSGTPDFSKWTAMYNYAQQGEYPKEFWMTETYREYNSYDDAMWMVAAIHGAMVYGNNNLWTQWSFDGQESKQGKPTKMLFTTANFARFVKPGAFRVDAVSDNSSLLTSAFIDEANGRLSIVAINLSDTPVSATLSGDNLPLQFEGYRTSMYEDLEDIGTVSDQVIFPGRSVTTLVAEGNSKPSVDQPDDMMLLMNPGAQSVGLTGISDGDGGTQGLTVVAESDNTALIDNISVGAVTDGMAALNFTPKTDQTGAATITVTLTDDGTGFGFNEEKVSFRVEVYDGYNNQPTIDRPADHYSFEDEGEQEVTIYGISDGDQGGQTLTLTAESDNPGLITGFTPILNGDGTATLKFNTAQDVYGEATVRVTIDDNGGTATNNGNMSNYQDFLVQVAPVNDAPSIDPVTNPEPVPVDAPDQVISLAGISYGDTFGPAQNLMINAGDDNPALISDITATMTGSTGEVTYSLVSGAKGTANITVTLRDDGGVVNNGIDSVKTVFAIVVSDNIGIRQNKVSTLIYPNPATDFVQIELQKSGYSQMFIADMSGKIMRTENILPFETSKRIDLSGIGKGSYLLILKGENEKEVFNLIIQ